MVLASQFFLECRLRAIAYNIDIRYWQSLMDTNDPIVCMNKIAEFRSMQRELLAIYWGTIAKNAYEHYSN